MVGDHEGDLRAADLRVDLLEDFDLRGAGGTSPKAERTSSSERPSRNIFLATKYLASRPSRPSFSFTLYTLPESPTAYRSCPSPASSAVCTSARTRSPPLINIRHSINNNTATPLQLQNRKNSQLDSPHRRAYITHQLFTIYGL